MNLGWVMRVNLGGMLLYRSEVSFSVKGIFAWKGIFVCFVGWVVLKCLMRFERNVIIYLVRARMFDLLVV